MAGQSARLVGWTWVFRPAQMWCKYSIICNKLIFLLKKLLSLAKYFISNAEGVTQSVFCATCSRFVPWVAPFPWVHTHGCVISPHRGSNWLTLEQKKSGGLNLHNRPQAERSRRTAYHIG